MSLVMSIIPLVYNILVINDNCSGGAQGEQEPWLPFPGAATELAGPTVKWKYWGLLLKPD